MLNTFFTSSHRFSSSDFDCCLLIQYCFSSVSDLLNLLVWQFTITIWVRLKRGGKVFWNFVSQLDEPLQNREIDLHVSKQEAQDFLGNQTQLNWCSCKFVAPTCGLWTEATRKQQTEQAACFICEVAYFVVFSLSLCQSQIIYTFRIHG